MHIEFYILNLANLYCILFNKCIYMHINFNYTYTNLENIPLWDYLYICYLYNAIQIIIMHNSF